ncbi:MAG: hypothetical protein PHT94_04175 [Candidatus Nanoarchaeia archaeon]|nr:hypothetical protein [Candidatus Nanoarchaeia archaeon]
MATKIWKIHPKYLDDEEIHSLFIEFYAIKEKMDRGIFDFDYDDFFLIFRNNNNPDLAFKAYLYQIYLEISKRGFDVSEENVESVSIVEKIPVTYKELKKEFQEYLENVKNRDIAKYISINNEVEILPNPIFNLAN